LARFHMQSKSLFNWFVSACGHSRTFTLRLTRCRRASLARVVLALKTNCDRESVHDLGGELCKKFIEYY
jgi:hypothetical protein